MILYENIRYKTKKIFYMRIFCVLEKSENYKINFKTNFL